MKPFNYEEWKRNPQQRIITRDGELVKRIKEDKKHPNKPLYVELENGTFYQAYKDGVFKEHHLKGMDLLFDDETDIENESELKWRKCKAGYKFPSDAIVVPDDERTTDRDPRLVRCAVWDSKYILYEDLKKLPIE